MAEKPTDSKLFQLTEVDVRLCLREGKTHYSDTPLSGPYEAAELMRDIMKDLDREMSCVINLDTKLRPINYNVVSIGSINASLVPIPNIFKSAILSNAASIMMLHNHPSGDVTPSREDHQVTWRILEASKLMDIPLMDHIIVGGLSNEYYSYRRYRGDMFKGLEGDEYISRMMGKENVMEENEITRQRALRAELKPENPIYKWDEVRGLSEADRRTFFQDKMENGYAIMQLRWTDETALELFASMDELGKMGVKPDLSHYEMTYLSELPSQSDTMKMLEDLYIQFNLNRPENFTGHSLSVSDVVAVKRGQAIDAYYVDTIGFQELPDFIRPENSLKNAEMSLEDDYDMIDGIINNGKKEEAKEETTEKPSVLARLKERSSDSALARSYPTQEPEL